MIICYHVLANMSQTSVDYFYRISVKISDHFFGKERTASKNISHSRPNRHNFNCILSLFILTHKFSLKCQEAAFLIRSILFIIIIILSHNNYFSQTQHCKKLLNIYFNIWTRSQIEWIKTFHLSWLHVPCLLQLP